MRRWEGAQPRQDVAPLAGSVDRNVEMEMKDNDIKVAPLTGRVDRNFTAWIVTKTDPVAPLTGRVGRKYGCVLPCLHPVGG